MHIARARRHDNNIQSCHCRVEIFYLRSLCLSVISVPCFHLPLSLIAWPRPPSSSSTAPPLISRARPRPFSLRYSWCEAGYAGHPPATIGKPASSYPLRPTHLLPGDCHTVQLVATYQTVCATEVIGATASPPDQHRRRRIIIRRGRLSGFAST